MIKYTKREMGERKIRVQTENEERKREEAG